MRSDGTVIARTAKRTRPWPVILLLLTGLARGESAVVAQGASDDSRRFESCPELLELADGHGEWSGQIRLYRQATADYEDELAYKALDDALRVAASPCAKIAIYEEVARGFMGSALRASNAVSSSHHYSAAISNLSLAQAERVSAFGEVSVEALHGLEGLSLAHRVAGNFEVEDHLRLSAIQLARRLHGRESVAVARLEEEFGESLSSRFDLDAAVEHYEKALELRRTLGPELAVRRLRETISVLIAEIDAGAWAEVEGNELPR